MPRKRRPHRRQAGTTGRAPDPIDDGRCTHTGCPARSVCARAAVRAGRRHAFSPGRKGGTARGDGVGSAHETVPLRRQLPAERPGRLGRDLPHSGGTGLRRAPVPDHLGATSPLALPTAAARTTSRLRLGTYVLNNGFRNPALLAREAATLGRPPRGRLEPGLGAGRMKSGFDDAGATAAQLTEQFGSDLVPGGEPLREHPCVLLGATEEMARALWERRERFGSTRVDTHGPSRDALAQVLPWARSEDRGRGRGLRRTRRRPVRRRTDPRPNPTAPAAGTRPDRPPGPAGTGADRRAPSARRPLPDGAPRPGAGRC